MTRFRLTLGGRLLTRGAAPVNSGYVADLLLPKPLIGIGIGLESDQHCSVVPGELP